MGDLVKKKQVTLHHIVSDKNPLDINSKNVKVEAHKRHAGTLYNGTMLVDPLEEDVELDHGPS